VAFDPFAAVGAVEGDVETIPGFGAGANFRYRLVPGTTGIAPEDLPSWKAGQQTAWEKAGLPPRLSSGTGTGMAATPGSGGGSAAAHDP
jgi:hypothetical protein